MKKILSVFSLLVLVFAISACSVDRLAIEDHKWKMRTVMSNNIGAAENEAELVLAVGKADELYPDAEIVDLTLTAENGKMTLTDRGNGKIYSGTYKLLEKTERNRL